MKYAGSPHFKEIVGIMKVYQGKAIPKIHDCRKLAILCGAAPILQKRLEDLTAYYSFTRYPDQTPSRLDASELQRIKEITVEVMAWTTKHC